MSENILQKYNALDKETKNIIEGVDKESLIRKLAKEYNIPLHGLLIQLLTASITPNMFRAAIYSLVIPARQRKNLFYILEENFLKPYQNLQKKHENFDELDQKGIDELSRRQNGIGRKKFYDLGRLAEVVIKNFIEDQAEENGPIFVNDDVLIKRLKNIVISYVKDIRDKLETKQTLMRSIKIGGMGLREKDVLRLLRIVDHERKNVKKYIREVVFKLDKKESKETLASAEKKEPKESLPRIEKIAPPPPMIITKRPLDKKSTPKKQSSASDIIRIQKQKSTPALKSSQEKSFQVKPRLVGPIEELRNITLVEFRRLSSRPKEAIEKIKDRIALLAEDSLMRRSLGIQAWESSEVYKEYLSLGRESLQTGKPLRDVIEERLQLGTQTLTKEEFNAIMELNTYLRS